MKRISTGLAAIALAAFGAFGASSLVPAHAQSNHRAALSYSHITGQGDVCDTFTGTGCNFINMFISFGFYANGSSAYATDPDFGSQNPLCQSSAFGGYGVSLAWRGISQPSSSAVTGGCNFYVKYGGYTLGTLYLRIYGHASGYYQCAWYDSSGHQGNC